MSAVEKAWQIARRNVPYFETCWTPNRNAILSAVAEALRTPAPAEEPAPVDPRTGRPCGDHGTAMDAINFALDTSQGLECEDFLRAWREGDLAEWPDFYEWLAAQERRAAA